MAEAAAVVGLVASIVTLVDLGAKIVSRIQDFTAQTTDVPQSFRSLADRLPLLIRTLQQVQARAQAGSVPDDVAQDLRTLINSINGEIELLEQCLDKVKTSAGASRLENTVVALQSLRKDKHVAQVVDKVHRGIDILSLHQTTTNVDLVDRILHKLAQLDLSQPSTSQSLGLWLGRAPQINPDAFLGRTAELQQLDDWLSPNNGALSQTQKVVSITGMGGLGKTQLSLAYTRQYGSQYSSVFWLNAQDKLSLQQAFSTLSYSIFSDDRANTSDTSGMSDTRDEERRVQRVRRWLSEPWNNRWLIIFDNYDDPALPNVRSPTGFDIREYLPLRSQGSVLITTRSPKLLFSRSLPLQKLDDITLQIAILSQRAGRDLSHEIDVERLAERLDGLPLALATAGTYINQTGASCTEYLGVYDELWNELHGPESEALLEYANRTLSSTWTVSVEQVRRQDADAAELLHFFALLNNEDIWYELLQAGASNELAWMDRVTATKVRFDRAITKLRDYSLVEVVPGSCRVHPCVHDWLLGLFQLSPDRMWFLAAIRCVARSMPAQTSLLYSTVSRRVVRHAQRLNQKQFHHLWQAYSREGVVIDASHDFGMIYQALDQFKQAEQMYLRALAGAEKAFGADHISTLTTVNSLGNLHAKQGKLAQAEQMYLRALAGKEIALGVDHTSTLNTINDLGALYHTQDKLAAAEQMFKRALAGREKALGVDHASTLDTVNNLGVLYGTQVKLAEAEQMFERALAGKEIALGADHTLTLSIVNNLGALYAKQGKLAAAEQMFKRALAGREKALGVDHTSTLTTVNKLGTLYYNQGKLVEAEQMYLRALHGYDKALGADHISTLSVVNNLGVLYVSQGKLVEVEQMYLRALAGMEKALGADHTLTLTVVNNLGDLYRAQGRLAEAEQMHTRALAGESSRIDPSINPAHQT